MRVLWKIDTARDIHRHIRIERSHSLCVHDLGRYAQLVCTGRHAGFIVERVLRFAKHHQPAFHEPEIIPRQRSQFLEQRAARKRKIANQRRALVHMRARRRAHEAPGPCHEFEIEPRFDVKRRLWIPHPLQPQRHHPRCGQRDEVRRHNHTRVSKGTAVALRRMPIHDRHTMPALRAKIRRAEPDDAASDDKDMFAHCRESAETFAGGKRYFSAPKNLRTIEARRLSRRLQSRPAVVIRV